MRSFFALRLEGLGFFTTLCDALGVNSLDFKGPFESNCLAHAFKKTLFSDGMQL